MKAVVVGPTILTMPLLDAVLPAELHDRYHDAQLFRRGAGGLLLRARQTATDREVVIKLFESSGGAHDEARLHGRVADVAGVVDLLDAGITAHGWTYLVTGFRPGGSLADPALLPRPPEEVVQIALEVATTLDAIHDRGVAHGDLKPSNLLIGASGEIELTDFGCASLIDADSTLSDSNDVFGTLAFAPPEQLEGAPVSASADIYAFGLTIGALLIGHSPQVIPGEAPMQFLDRLTSGDPPDFDHPSIPASLRPLLREMCQRDPARRPFAAVVAARLGSIAEDEFRAGVGPSRFNRGSGGAARSRATPGGRPGRRGIGARWFVATVLLAGAAGAFGYTAARSNVDRQALVFCRSYGELANSAIDLLAGAEQRFRTAPSFSTALDTMLNDLPSRYATSYRRFEQRRDQYPDSIRDDIALAAPQVARLEMADYLARLDGSFLFDEQRRVRIDRVPAPLRDAAQAYTAVDQLAVTTCGLVDSSFPGAKERLVADITEVLASGGGEFFGEASNASLIPLDAAELVPEMAPRFAAGLAGAYPEFFVAMFDTRPDVAAVVVARHPGFVVDVIESARRQGWTPGDQRWLSDLRASIIDDPELADRLAATFGG